MSRSAAGLAGARALDYLHAVAVGVFHEAKA
jgi:hypothetical protein